MKGIIEDFLFGQAQQSIKEGEIRLKTKELYLAGKRGKEIALELNRLGYRKRSGKKFTAQTVYALVFSLGLTKAEDAVQ